MAKLRARYSLILSKKLILAKKFGRVKFTVGSVDSGYSNVRKGKKGEGGVT